MKLVVMSLFVSVLLYNNGWAEKRLPELSDLYRIKTVSEPDISPDGKSVVYTVEQLNYDKNVSFSNIWKASLDGKQHQQLTYTDKNSNSSPKWSPDGQWIAFLSDTKEENDSQIWLLPAKGGKPRQLTKIHGEISDYIWSPDSRNIVFVAKVSKKDKDDDLEPIVLNRYQFKTDNEGYLTNIRNHLYLINIRNKTITTLTSGQHDEYLPDWSPNGKYIAYVSKRMKDPDRNFNYNIYIIDPKNHKKERQVTYYSGCNMDPEFDSNLSWSPDSTRIAYLRSEENLWIYYAPSQLAVVDIRNGKEQTIAPRDQWFYKPKWSSDGLSLYALIEENRTSYLNHIDLQTGKTRKITHGLHYDLDFDLKNGTLVLLSTDDLHPAELFAIDSKITPITQHNKKLLEEVKFQPAKDIEFKSFDGTPVFGLMILPDQFQSGKTYPTLLYLHGGPVDQFSHSFDFDMQWIAANGYVVIEPNPRGSSGRGFQYAKAIYSDWGNLDVKDVLAAVDYVVSLGIADPDKLAVGGWSYGAILTNYVIASDTRFKAALSGAGSANVFASYGIDQYTREYESELGKPWDNPELYLKLSYPFLKSNRIKTATLFMCGQLDFNVPCEGSEQLYQALISLHVPTELVIYPKEHHSLETPLYNVDRLRRYIDWLNLYLK